MILFREFNEEEKIDRIWYQSSMVVYSECQDKPDTPLKDVKVVFKNGSSYLYKDINVNDYVAFVHGGLDGSNGKALNKFIKPNCSEYKRLEDVDLAELQATLEQKLMELKPKEEEKVHVFDTSAEMAQIPQE